MELREILRVIRMSWWLPIVCAVVGASTGATMSFLATPTYRADTQFFVSATDSASTAEAYQGGQLSEQRVISYARLLEGEELAARVIDVLNLNETTEDFVERVSATAVEDTVLLDVTVTDTSPNRAQRIAAALASEFESMVAELETPTSGGESPVRVTTVLTPEAPTEASSPRTLLNITLGAIVGLLLGLGLAVARTRLDRTIRTADEASDIAESPVLAALAFDPQLRDRHLVRRDAYSATAEAYRQLRTNLEYVNIDSPLRILTISSAVPEEGKTTLAVNLALVLAEGGRRVALVEADLRRPRITRYLGMVGGAGVTSVLTGKADVADVLQDYGDGRVSVLASGPLPPNPGELVTSKQMASLVRELSQKYDYVVLDAPPILPVADASGLATLSDGVLLSLRYGATHKDEFRRAVETVDRVGANVLGIVLNFVPVRASNGLLHGYNYQYTSDAASHRRGK